MSVTLAVRFPLGRYHATPWARHANEGAIDLPPSAWRLLRALYSVWKLRAPDLDEEVMHGLLAELAVPPTVFVPHHSVAHTRHYYPDSKHTSTPDGLSVDRTLDAFAVFDPEAELGIQWRAVELTGPQRDALAKLAVSLPYLGRADSVCEARVAEDWQPDDHDVWQPLDVAEHIDDGAETVTVLAPEPPLDIGALVARPVQLRKQKLLFPAGTRFLAYQKVTAARRARPAATPSTAPVEAVRFSLTQPVLPRDTDTVIYTDLLRSAALSKLGKSRPDPKATVLGGKTTDSTAARDDHRHAHYLPILNDRGHIEALVVWAPGLIPGDELRALRCVERLHSGVNDKWRATVRVAGAGQVTDVAPELAGASRSWRSVTPFVPSRYPKKSRDWADFLRAEVERELGFREFEGVRADVEVLDESWWRFRRLRPSSARPPNRPAAWLRIRLDREVSGPLALGSLSHFGLGLFVPENGMIRS